jgi:5-methylcytosine-specific restriction enzyme B
VEDNANNLTDTYKEFRKDGRIEFITFHPAYSYEEFIEGITVGTDGEDKPSEQLQYKLKAGIFKTFCKRALADAIGLLDGEIEKVSWKEVYDDYLELEGDVDFEEAPRYVLIIDEINRGDIAKIFGELITLLEADKRLGEENELVVKLPTSGDHFGVPPNVYIIGTMNTADRSIALLDVALRRRFGFVEMNPDFEALQKEHIEKNKDRFEEGVYNLLVKSRNAVEKINRKLCLEKTIGRDRQIGQSFFFKVYTISDLQMVWKHEILPLLEEYCYSDYQKINKILFVKDSDTEWISEAEGITQFSDLNKMLSEILKNEQSA